MGELQLFLDMFGALVLPVMFWVGSTLHKLDKSMAVITNDLCHMQKQLADHEQRLNHLEHATNKGDSA